MEISPLQMFASLIGSSPAVALFGSLGFLTIVFFATIYQRRLKQREEALREELNDLRFNLDRAADPGAQPRARSPLNNQLSLEVPEALVKSCSNGECVLVTGGGIAAQAGLPTWTELMANFLSHLETVESDFDWSPVRNQLLKGDHSLALDMVESRHRLKELQSAIVEQFGKQVDVPASLSEILTNVPFAGVLTLTPDKIVERSARRRRPKILSYDAREDYSRLIREKQFFVLKLYGDIEDQDTLIATSKQYAAVVEDAPDLKTFVRSIFSSKSMLFVGVSPQGLIDFLDASGIRQGGSLGHFALVPERADFDVLAERFRTKYNITLLRYRPSPGFPEVSSFLHDLASRVGNRTAEQSPKETIERTLVPSKIEKLSLVNIGPFRKANFNFDTPWTILLGNNGSGKSTVLKAVALALSGEDEQARRFSRQLLRVGAVSGFIEIQVGSIAYRTTLRSSRGRVEVRAEQIPPLKAGTLPTFGFPSIRGVVLPSSKFDANESFPYPRVEDVLPLLAGGLDERMANLKAWIINTWIKAQGSIGDERQKDRYRGMLEKFFKLIDDLTPGFELRLNSCDVSNNEVILDTSDGPLSLEYISQGMSSTMGWVGVLLQRLFDIYDRTDRPEEGHGLLLIDEIDSHLHPEWQRSLIPKVKELFPNLQVIATTHSPLMVGNTEKGELIRIDRNGETLSIRTFDVSFEGYRADQILTTEAFGLPTTRGLKSEKRRATYADLLGRTNRTAKDEERFKEVERELEEAPRAQETIAARRAADFLDEQLVIELKKLAAEKEPSKLVEAIETYAAKVKSGE
jgi:predicted ATPase